MILVQRGLSINLHSKAFHQTFILKTSFLGSVFMMATEAAQEICEEDTNLNVNVVIRNLKEEAKDDSEESGVDDGED